MLRERHAGNLFEAQGGKLSAALGAHALELEVANAPGGGRQRPLPLPHANRADPHHRQAAHASAQRLGRRPRGRGRGVRQNLCLRQAGVGGMQSRGPWSARRRRRAASAALGQRRARHPRALASRGANSSSSMLWRWLHSVTVLVIGWWVWWVWWVNSSHQHAGSILPRSDEHPPRIPPSPPFPLLHAAY
jgi:hypothetical protein